MLESLPSETYLNILLNLPDVDTLDSLLRASPVAWRIFNRFGVNIFSNALNAAALDTDTKIIIRTIFYVRQGCLPVSSLEELQVRVTHDSMTHRRCRGMDGTEGCRIYYGYQRPWHEHVDKIFSPDALPECCTVAGAKAMIATYKCVLSNTLDCLNLHLQRFRRSRPRIPMDFKWLACDFNFGETPIQPWSPATRPWLVKDIGPPMWLEEQLLMRAFWRVQFVLELNSVLNKKDVKHWLDRRLGGIIPFSHREIYNFRAVESSISCAHHAGLEISSDDAPLPSELSLIELASEYLVKRSRPASNLTWRGPRPSPRPGDYDKLSRFWNEGAIRAFEVMTRGQMRGAHRKLGFEIWCAERLDGYGFAAKVGHHGRNLFVWLSVVPWEDAEKENSPPYPRCTCGDAESTGFQRTDGSCRGPHLEYSYRVDKIEYNESNAQSHTYRDDAFVSRSGMFTMVGREEQKSRVSGVECWSREPTRSPRRCRRLQLPFFPLPLRIIRVSQPVSAGCLMMFTISSTHTD